MKRIEKYTEALKELRVKGYTGTAHEDNLLLQWWSSMVDSGELTEIFAKSCLALGNFYKLFQRPNWLFYREDKEGLQLAIWAEPMFSTACVGLWVAPRSRKSKEVFRAIQLIYYALFTIFNGVIGVTKRENLLTEHVKLGYTVVGKVSSLIDDEPAWIVHLSREAFNSGRLFPKE